MNKNFGLSLNDFSILEKILKSNLSKKKNFIVDVFGSRAKGKERKYSDIDLWIECEPKLSEAELSSLHTDFEDSDLSIQVDVVTPDRVLEEYRDRINSERKPWLRTQIRI